MKLLDDVSGLLDAHGVSHALIGAAALAAAGVARSTYDVDLLTGDSRVLQRDLWNGLRELGASIEIRRGDEEDPLGGVVRIESGTDRPVDLIVAKHNWQIRAVQRAARPAGGPPVVMPADLILLKLYSGGTQDLWDIRELLRLPEGANWAAAVEADLVALPESMRDRWKLVQE
jgi:hypothetical protein